MKTTTRHDNATTAKKPRTRAAIWQEFLRRLAENLGHGAQLVRPKPTVAWRDGIALNRVELLQWTQRDPREPGPPPMVTRIALNTMMFHPSKALLRHLGFHPQRPPDMTPSLRLEWTVLGEELVGFAEWLPIWIRDRGDLTVDLPQPPHASHIWGEGLRTTVYAWTVAAWEAQAARRRIGRRVTRPASQRQTGDDQDAPPTPPAPVAPGT